MKNYKILRIYTAAPYQNMYAKLYAEHQLENRSYEESIRTFCNHGYIVSGQWSSCMKELGNEAIDVVPDFLPFQKKWAQENGIGPEGKNFNLQTALLLLQIEKIKPDVLFFYAGGWTLIPDDLRKQLKSMYPFIKVITGLWGDPLPPNQNYSKFQDADLLFCAYEHNIRAAEERGLPAVLNGNCFDPFMAKMVAQQQKHSDLHDFIFAGSSGYGFPDHVNRYQGLIQLIENVNLKIWCYEPKISKKFIVRDSIRDSITTTLASLPKNWLNHLKNAFSEANYITSMLDNLVDRLLGSKYKNRTLRLIEEAMKQPSERYGAYKWDLSLKPLKKLFPDKCFPSKFGIEYFELLRNAKIVFNRHTGETVHAGNIRMFEVTGMGSCLMTDNPKECKRLFELDEEIVAYSSIEECIEKVKYLLAHEEKRKAIAEKGKKRTLRDHTLMNRCSMIHDSLQKIL